MERKGRKKARATGAREEVFTISLLVLAFILLLGLISYKVLEKPEEKLGIVGSFISGFLIRIFGWSSFLFPIIIGIYGLWGRGRRITLLILPISFSAVLSTIGGGSKGGEVGDLLSLILVKAFGDIGAGIISVFAVAISVLMAFDIPLFKLLRNRRRKARREEKPRVPEVPAAEAVDSALPPLSLLSDPPREQARDEEDLERRKGVLEQVLEDFGIEARVVGAEVGPAVTRFEVKPARGIKVSRIASLSDDISLAMRASHVRILAPVPGEDVIGVEVPNQKVSIVYLKEIVESLDPGKAKSMRLPLLIGKTISGEPYIVDLFELPHLLIAGATGSGKSVCINSIICSLLLLKTPEDVRFILVDPKRIELNVFRDIPHLLAPIVDSRKAPMALSWAVEEMERRYEMLGQEGARSIDSYNDMVPREKRMPWIVIIVDELADIMMVWGSRIENLLIRLAQMGRASGIHLVLSTQRPSVDVITGLIKANFPSRIAFQVSSKADSRTILDMGGAERLFGKGDMLFMSPRLPKPVRIQGSYVPDGDVERIAAFLREKGGPRYVEDFSSPRRIYLPGRMEDELFDEAVELVVERGQASTAILQRHLKIGYARAAKLLEMMEEAGIVGPPRSGGLPREVLVGSEFLKRGDRR
jgi:S-DNA-T family DNA segregation ATPase FtsK/SpoIIIE